MTMMGELGNGLMLEGGYTEYFDCYAFITDDGKWVDVGIDFVIREDSTTGEFLYTCGYDVASDEYYVNYTDIYKR